MSSRAVHVGVSASQSQQRFAFGLSFFKRFLRISGVLFPACVNVVTLLFVFLLALSLLEQFLIFNLGIVPSKFYKILGEKDKPGFIRQATIALLLIIAEAFIKSTITYVSNVLYITWRKTLSTHLHSLYFKGILFYQVNVIHKKIDNPDQRITQDVDKMCNTFSQIIAPLIISPFTIGYYTYQASESTGYIGPVSILVFFILATVLNKFLMTPVVDYFYRQERMEGNFRFKHMQMRIHSEAVAFYRSGQVEEERTNRRLESLIDTQHALFRREYALNFLIKSCDYLGSILSYVALAFPIFAGRYDDLSAPELGALVSKNAFVCIYLINCFTKLIDLAALTTDVAGAAHRIGELLEHLGSLSDESSANYAFLESDSSIGSNRRSNKEESETAETEILIINDDGLPADSNLSNQPKNSVAVAVRDVTFGPPKSKTICCRGLNLEVGTSRRVLVTGDSGCGKSSLLRVINGLWSTLSGNVVQKTALGPKGLFFLPQLPYFTDGSIREQVIYPLKLTRNESVSGEDEVILENLEYVGMLSLVDRVGGLDTPLDWNWYDELSPGEMQRLSFVRLFYHKPPFAVLDEATSQIGHAAETDMYCRCADLGISVLSVGHRESLRQFHDLELHMEQDGSWELIPLSHHGERDAL